MTEVGTLKELNVKPGDVVQWQMGYMSCYTVSVDSEGHFRDAKTFDKLSADGPWRIISRAPDKPKLWKDMTPEEKGALLLAHHEGMVIEATRTDIPDDWRKVTCFGLDFMAYRVRPEPKVDTVTVYGAPRHQVQWRYEKCALDTHRITFNMIDGKPDCDSVKMEKL